MATRERNPQASNHAGLWGAAGAAVVGVLLGGAAVYVGLSGRSVTSPSQVSMSADGDCCGLAAPSEGMRPGARSLAEAVAATQDTVVTLRGEGGTLGAGVIVDSAGIILTNLHVVAPGIEGARLFGAQQSTSLIVRLANGRELPATLLIGDREQDLAVLRMQPADSSESFRAAILGRSSELVVGAPIFVIGTPLGLDHSVSSGIVAALDRRHILANHRLPLIQIDASINFGSSGGPLFNLDGELVGITTARAERAQGIGFAIPIDYIRELLRAFGEGGVRRSGHVGIEVDPKLELSRAAYERGYRNGAVVTGVLPGSPAELAGLRLGDVLVEVGGRRFDAFGEGGAARLRFAQNFVDIVRAAVPGEELRVTVIRGAETVALHLEIVAATSEAQVGVDAEELLGLQLAAEGIKITGLHPGSESWPLREAAEPLRDAEIVQILGRPIRDRRELGETLAELRQIRGHGRIGTVSIVFRLRDGSSLFAPDFPIARP